MKEKIEAKLLEHADKILEHETLTTEEINFLVFILNRIEMKESAEQSRLAREESDRAWRERMTNMIEMAGGM